MNKKTVLHVVESLNFGGVESQIKIIAKNSGLSDFDHQFCVIGCGGAISDELAGYGKSAKILGVRSRIPSLVAIWKLIRFIRKERPDILHTRGAEANFHGLIAGSICRVPVCVGEEIGFPSHSRQARFTFRQIYRLAHRVVAISEAVRSKLIELNEVSAEHVEVLLNPTQMLAEQSSHPTPDRFEVGFVGRLEEVKNPVALIQAAALLHDRGFPVHVTIVGDGSQRQFLEEEIVRLKLTDVVKLLGFDPKPFDRLKNIALYVQPSVSEGFGLALVEAMSAGIPVLATSVGGTPEIITNGVNGWLLDDTVSESIAHGIEKCVEMDPAELKEFGRIGRNSVLERFSPAAYFKGCDTLYKILIQERGL